MSAAAVLVVCGSLLSGCSNSQDWQWSKFERPKTSEQYLDLALESPRPDDRRRGVVGLADGPDATSDWAVKVFDTIARTDRDPMVRCAALRALSKSISSQRLPTALKLLKSADGDYEDVRQSPPPVRWAAARLLLILVQGSSFGEDQRGQITGALIERLPAESDRRVRLTMIETLGYFPERRVLVALVDALEDEDFAIQHAAELALAGLTGVTHDHYAAAWRKWLDETPEPFARAGEIPPELRERRSKPMWDWLEWWE